MVENSGLSRRERQIMEVVFELEEATVSNVVEKIPDSSTPMAIRRLMHILVEKGFLKSRKAGREMVYFPSQRKVRAGREALQRVLQTFFGGSLADALAVHFGRRENIDEAELAQMIELIEKARKENR
ncbi:MAG: BlaI/MecI/CopY family transcriptional regulator [Pirellulaceae bacterium]